MAISKTKIQLRRDTSINWINANPILLKGEYAYETDTGYVMVGNGVDTITSLKATKFATLRLPKTAIDGLADINTNTIYDLSNISDMGFTLISADGTLSAPVWGVVKSYVAKDWTSLINTSKSEAITEAELYADSQDAVISANTLLCANSYADIISSALSDTVASLYVKFDDVNGGKDALTADNKIATLRDIAGLSGVIHFRGVFSNDERTTGIDDKQAFINEFNPVNKGDLAINSSNSKEYLAIKDSAESVDVIELGDESLYETKADAELKLWEAKDYADEQISDAFEASKEYTDTQVGNHLSARHIPDDVTTLVTSSGTMTAFNVFANGIPVLIKQGKTDSIVEVWYDNKVDDTYNKMISVDTTQYSEVGIYGGCVNNEDYATYIPTTNIRMESGKVTTICGGSLNNGNVGVANVTINGGSAYRIVASRSDAQSLGLPATKHHYNNVGQFNLTINDILSSCIVYGGGMGYSTVGNSNVVINNAQQIDNVTAGGANGVTTNGKVTINGGNITSIQSGVRGAVTNAEINVNGGNITRLFAGNTKQSEDTAIVFKTVLNLVGGKIEELYRGNSGISPFGNISGKYVPSKIILDKENVEQLLKKIGGSLDDLGALAFKDTIVQSDMEGLFVFNCGEATEEE